MDSNPMLLIQVSSLTLKAMSESRCRESIRNTAKIPVTL